MKKISLIPMVLILLVGVVWAGSSLFPEKAGFPTFPTGPATIGGALSSWFDITTGTANNTALLAGRSATGYLQNTSCTTPGDIWKGIDATGKAICGPRGALLAFAKILEGTMQVNGVSKPIGTILHEGDRIDTNVSQTGTIQFTDDISIARLSTNTSIILERGDTAGTIAQVVLDQGLLWGRVLTSTGINIGGGGLIAGVRGTSVSVEKEGALYHLSIPHSTSTTAAATVTCGGGSPRTMIPGSILNSGGCDTLTQFSLPQLYTDKWIAENTRKDLVYLDSINTNSHIAAEILATDPIQLDDKRGTCGSILNEPNTGSGIWDTASNSCITGFADYSSSEDTAFHIGNDNIPMTNGVITVQDDGRLCLYDGSMSLLWGHAGPNDTRVFGLSDWNSIIPPSYASTDQSKIATAFPSINALLSNGKELTTNRAGCSISGGTGWNKSTYPNGYYYYDTVNRGIYITGSGSIRYAPGSLGNLAEKKVTIQLSSLPGTTAGTLLYLNSSTQVVYTTSGWSYYGVSCNIDASGTNISCVIPLGTTVSDFIVGNSRSGNGPIKTTIKKITIQ